MAEVTATTITDPKRIWTWLVTAVILSAGVSAVITYSLAHNHNSNVSKTPTLSVTNQVDQDLSDNNAQAAMSLFNNQPASFRNSQPGQELLSSIYMNQKNYSQALAVVRQIGVKYGWNYFLTLQAVQISMSMKNYQSAIQYDQQTISLINTEISRLNSTAK